MSIITNQAPIYETLIPAANGVITKFYTSYTFKTNSVSVWLNGLLLLDSWATGYTLYLNTSINMKIAPLTNDTLEIKYDIL